jgi:hypothetical protein
MLQAGLLQHAFMLLLLVIVMVVLLLLQVHIIFCAGRCLACSIRLISCNPVRPIVCNSMCNQATFTQVAWLSCKTTSEKTICCFRRQLCRASTNFNAQVYR